MIKRSFLAALLIVPLLITAVVLGLAHGHTLALLVPHGLVAEKERNLLVFGAVLSLVVVLPVFALTFTIAWKYRASRGATYTPDWDRHRGLEFIWWGIPFTLIFILGIITWRSSHELDPHQALASSKPPLTIQVVALDWKWLFIYPDQNLASVNYLRVPVGTPVNFDITADAPMNSFWIPQLGSQIYAMPGMSTRLSLQADQPGVFRGSSANISGRGFAGMTFSAEATSQTGFDDWVANARQGSRHLDLAAYRQLVRPSTNVAPFAYASVDPGLYDEVVMQYMMPGSPLSEAQ